MEEKESNPSPEDSERFREPWTIYVYIWHNIPHGSTEDRVQQVYSGQDPVVANEAFVKAILQAQSDRSAREVSIQESAFDFEWNLHIRNQVEVPIVHDRDMYYKAMFGPDVSDDSDITQ